MKNGAPSPDTLIGEVMKNLESADKLFERVRDAYKDSPDGLAFLCLYHMMAANVAAGLANHTMLTKLSLPDIKNAH